MCEELKKIRIDMLKSVHKTNSSHIGGALSVVDILYTLYEIKKENDVVILSKGHCSLALYAVLKNKGLITEKDFNKICIDGGKFCGHLDRFSNKNIFASTGSLGHGLPIAVGLALADRTRNVYVVMGDGETQEGTTWEAARMAVEYRLNNLIVIVDYNRFQGLAMTAKMMIESRLFNMWKAVGFDAINIDGHNHKDINKSIQFECNRPKVIIAHTIKGYPISYMMNKLAWHYKSPNDEELDQAYRELKK